MNLRRLYYLLSPSTRLMARRLYYLPLDLFEKISGRRDKLTPPRGMIFVGSGDFRKTGDDLVNRVIVTCGLKPDTRVLDVGCGIGRLAVPLTQCLSEGGSYEGFDVVSMGVKWCTKNITSKYPNFNFLHVDLKNDLYNLNTETEAKSFRFPYGDNEFDQVILTSVFTHMMPDDLVNYLWQIHRVLKPEGKCFATFFLLNNTVDDNQEDPNRFSFPHSYGVYSLMDKKVKEANIAYDESWLLHFAFPKNNLKVENIEYGWWSGRSKTDHLYFQDTIILSKQ